MAGPQKKLIILKGSVQTPPFSSGARYETGRNLRVLQSGELLSMPISRPMPSIGKNCHELRIQDEQQYWRVVYHVDTQAIVILDIFAKKTEKMPKSVLDACKQRLGDYLERRPKEGSV